MAQIVYVRLSYEDRASEEVSIRINYNVDFSKNSNRKKLLSRLLKQTPNVTEVKLLF